jgi:hypothetical protein
MGLFAGRGGRDIFLGLLKGYDGQGRMKEFIMERDKENGWLFVSFHDSFENGRLFTYGLCLAMINMRMH